MGRVVAWGGHSLPELGSLGYGMIALGTLAAAHGGTRLLLGDGDRVTITAEAVAGLVLVASPIFTRGVMVGLSMICQYVVAPFIISVAVTSGVVFSLVATPPLVFIATWGIYKFLFRDQMGAIGGQIEPGLIKLKEALGIKAETPILEGQGPIGKQASDLWTSLQEGVKEIEWGALRDALKQLPELVQSLSEMMKHFSKPASGDEGE